MKYLIKIILVLALLFVSTFLIVNLTGLVTIAKIEYWMQAADQLSPLYVAVVVILLLFCDLFIAVPTLTISISAGFFLGFPWEG
ncbi:hypothetical protein [Fodinibius halophilus]|uniref:hypothetical protein n=1 Tax=Fodinibius halophilus TaxID=1736908 RepID=UPI00197ACC0B|nr:hypothetical protein [Fodinibius halophilus]